MRGGAFKPCEDSDFCSEWVGDTTSLQGSDLIRLRFLNELLTAALRTDSGLEAREESSQESTAVTQIRGDSSLDQGQHVMVARSRQPQ